MVEKRCGIGKSKQKLSADMREQALVEKKRVHLN
jgi:hypothetical protein